MEEILKKLSVDDIEKLRLLLSILPTKETSNQVSLRIFEDEYFSLIQQNRSKAYYISVQSAFKHLTNFFGKQKIIQSIGLKDVEKFVTYLQLKVKKGFRVYCRTLNAAFNKAVDWGYVSENFFPKIKLPKRQKLAPAFISSEQLTVISEQIKTDIVKDVFVFAFYTGMRLNEILNLRWKNVDLKNGLITVGDESFITKGRNQRFIPISEEAKNAIENCELRMHNEKQKPNNKIHSIKDASTASRVTNGYVFCKKDGSKYSGNYVSRKFKKACKAVGMDSVIHFHSLRHSFASDLVQKGVPLYTIKELLGHSSISTTEIYSHLNIDSLREAIAKFDTSASFSAGSRNTKEEVKEKSKKEHTPSFPLSRGESNEVKIFRINSGEK